MTKQEAEITISEKIAEINELDHGLSLAQQQNDNLTKHLEETKDSLTKLQAMHSQQIEAQQVKYENDF